MFSLDIALLEDISPSSSLGIRWESLVRGNSASGFMQSLHWAEVKRRQGIASIHIAVFQDDELIGGCIFYTSTKRNGAGILVAPEGPVLPWDNEPLAAEMLRLIMDAAQSCAGELGVMAMRIEPRLPPPPISLLREFGRAPVDLIPKDTLYIDLSLPVESMLAGMKPKGRYNIKLSERHGVTVREDTTGDGISSFYNVMIEAGNRDDFAVEPLSFFEHLAAVLCPIGIARFFFSEHEGDILGALLLITYGNRATYLYGGISNKKRHLMGGYCLQWSAMQAAKDIGCDTYDFYGFNAFRAPDHRYARFSQFKSQFGGNAIRFIGAQDYFFLDNLADVFIKAVNQSRDQSDTLPGAENPPSLDVLVKQECLA